MKDFIVSSKLKKLNTSSTKIDLVIEKFNQKIQKDEDGGSYSLNTILDDIPYLNEAETEKITKQALKMNYKFKASNDNYQSVMYSIKKI